MTPHVDDSIVRGPIAKAVVRLALPVVLGMFMEFALSITDYFWVGKLGPTAQDAVTSSMVIIWTIFATMSIISVGVTALVARYVGARDFTTVSYYIKQGLAMAVGMGLLFSVIGYVYSPSLLEFMDTGEATLANAVPYIRIFFLSALLFFLAETAYAAFRASGNTRTPTLVGVAVVIINMVLDPCLILGWGLFPALGVKGASLATAVAIGVGTVVIFILMSRGGLGYRLGSMFSEKPDLRSILKIGRIGLPMAGQQFVFVGVYWFLIKIVHEFGDVAGAGMGIGNRMESLSYLTCYGFSVAASTMVGQNLGARQPGRAARCAWGATGLAIVFTAAISVLFITLPHAIASIFSDNPEVRTIAADYLFILGISQMAMAVEIVLEGAFSGAGDTVPPMLVMVPGSAIRIPLAYYLAFNLEWGINGVWWTLTITSILKSIVLGLWFARGKWKEKEV